MPRTAHNRRMLYPGTGTHPASREQLKRYDYQQRRLYLRSVIYYLTAYIVDRHFGGQEEGGWWYNWNTHLATQRIPKAYRKPRNHNKLEAFKEAMQTKYAEYEHGDIYSVRGGEQINIYYERTPREHQSTERPYYE